jgi:hypothetical protein
MTAYTGMKAAELPPAPELDNLDDLKRLAGISENSYGEETSKYATNLGQIQRERGIKAGDPEWFKLWFTLPLLTKTNPLD